ncbi:MAG TPA: hypothetical protein VFH61_06285 [Thermoleophilia bacterium]|nr:hypothetical protein [Thermoleophilia bacterium]
MRPVTGQSLSRSVNDVFDNLRDFVREWDICKPRVAGECLGLLEATASGVEDLRQTVRTSAADPKAPRQSALLCKKSADEVRRRYDQAPGDLF